MIFQVIFQTIFSLLNQAPEPLESLDRLEDHVDVGVAEGAPARLGGDGVAPVVDISWVCESEATTIPAQTP